MQPAPRPWTTNGPESNLFGLEPNFGCCTANFHQGWPKLTSNLWMAGSNDGLAAIVYAPSEVHTTIRKTPVRIIEETDYPFRDKIRITLHPEKPLPSRCNSASPHGQRVPAFASMASSNPRPTWHFARIERTWKPGDIVELTLPSNPAPANGFNNSIAFERGPLVFSYPIGEDWLKLRDRGMTADWQVYPTTQWNYAVSTDSIKATESPVAEDAFSLKGTPVKLEVKARKVPAWVAEEGVANPVPQSPVTQRSGRRNRNAGPLRRR